MHQVLKRLWFLPLLLGGCAISYQYWHTVLGFVALLLSLLLFLPLTTVSFNDVLRARNIHARPALFEMNLPLPRPLFGGPIAAIFDQIAGLLGSLEVLGLLATILVGLGMLGYVGVLWLIHLVSNAQYLAASYAGLLGLLATGAALARIPAALIVVFGSATICATVFLSGYGSVLLP